MNLLASIHRVWVAALLFLIAALVLLDAGQVAKGKEDVKKWNKEITNSIGTGRSA